jgi:hypothetical protein
MITITKENYPNLLKAFQLVAYDNQEDEPDSVDVEDFEEDLTAAEGALALLGSEEFETVCIGDMDEKNAIVQESTGLGVADKILDEYFESLS